ncbi:MAG: membrane-bound O-acyltransferase family protein [Flavobacteriaceae bacterium]|nr:membrane-bound O-acyltransferase family protein [Flavobacteriaceae bacterium]|tara:strand:- start:26195 stop:27619 length:1425 start_codon:yes stop_codon:yes gene_type:complete
MLFNSFDFGLFLVIAYCIYWGIGVQRLKVQNLFILVASYFFYAFWDWRFLILIIASSLVDYLAGLYIEKNQSKSKRKVILWSSVIWNLGVLFLFKYFNFFIESFEALFNIESSSNYNFWNVAIPVGLSFYTFQTMSYTIDVYKRKIAPTKNLLHFLCFVSFFPQLVAGPIEKAKDLIPQFAKQRKFDFQKSKEGLRQILWGLFKKIIVAEKLGLAVDMVYNQPGDYNFITLLFAGTLFFFQLYCDFSGYTDIAIGTAKLFGFKLSKNFNLPYLATSISDIWQRWHITLTRWFTDYCYIPFVSSFKKSPVVGGIGIILTMTLVGFWHGADWNFLVFGFLNGLIIVLERISLFQNKITLRKFLTSKPYIFSFIYTTGLYTVLCLIFRAQSYQQLDLIFSRIFSFALDGAFTTLIGWKLGYLIFMLFAELLSKNKDYPLQQFENWAPKPVRWVAYYAFIFIIIRYAEPKEAFIYFQF